MASPSVSGEGGSMGETGRLRGDEGLCCGRGGGLRGKTKGSC